MGFLGSKVIFLALRLALGRQTPPPPEPQGLRTQSRKSLGGGAGPSGGFTLPVLRMPKEPAFGGVPQFFCSFPLKHTRAKGITGEAGAGLLREPPPPHRLQKVVLGS